MPYQRKKKQLHQREIAQPNMSTLWQSKYIVPKTMPYQRRRRQLLLGEIAQPNMNTLWQSKYIVPKTMPYQRKRRLLLLSEIAQPNMSISWQSKYIVPKTMPYQRRRRLLLLGGIAQPNMSFPWQSKYIYTTKIMESVYMYVRLCVSPCFEVSSWKLAWGWRTGPRGLWTYFRSDPTWGQRSFRGQSALKMPYGYQIWW